jgi:hypothetical protein
MRRERRTSVQAAQVPKEGEREEWILLKIKMSLGAELDTGKSTVFVTTLVDQLLRLLKRLAGL